MSDTQNALATLSMDQLAALYLEAKVAEDDAKEYRRYIGEEIARRAPAPEIIPASTNASTDRFKVHARYENNVKLCAPEGYANESEAYVGLRTVVPEAVVNNLIKPKFEVSGSYVKYLRNNEPQTFELIAPFLTSKPGTPQISVEPRGQQTRH